MVRYHPTANAVGSSAHKIVDFLNEIQGRIDGAKKIIENYQNDLNKG